MKAIFPVLLFISFNMLFAQHSVTVKYSGQITSSNYKGISQYSIEYSINILNDYLEIGISADGEYSTINNDFIKNKPELNVVDRTYSLGLFLKYFCKIKILPVKPFLNLGVGHYFGKLINDGKLCENQYSYSLSNDYYINIGGGILLFPKSSGHIIIGLNYQVRYPRVTYQKPNCRPDYGYTEYTEKVNLSALLWNIGFRYDF